MLKSSEFGILYQKVDDSRVAAVAFVLATELFELLELFDEFIGLNAEKFGVWDFISEGG